MQGALRTFLLVVLGAVAGAGAERPPIVAAAKNGDREAMRALVQAKADVNAAEADGTTALHWVSYRDDLEGATLLIAAIDRKDVTFELRQIAPADKQAILAYSKPDSTSDREEAQDFTGLLLPEDVRLLTGKTRLFISPHRILHGIPFHALTFEGRFLIETFAVAYAPNLSADFGSRVAALWLDR